MRVLIVGLFLSTFLFANEFINGTLNVLVVEKNDSIKRGETTLPSVAHPTNVDKRVVFIAVPYAQKNDIELLINNEKRVFKVKKGGYKEETLSVEPSRVSPPKEALERIKVEREEALAIYNSRTPQRYWSEAFIRPMGSVITSQFGNARVFNDKLQTYHSGTDFRAAVGTPIYATNDGVIALANDDRYYAGGSVIIDHGEGIYSQYYHLSSLHVEVGQKVTKGEKLGLSGATGRVTGPHLHFGIMVSGVSVDPLDFIKKIEELY